MTRQCRATFIALFIPPLQVEECASTRHCQRPLHTKTGHFFLRALNGGNGSRMDRRASSNGRSTQGRRASTPAPRRNAAVVITAVIRCGDSVLAGRGRAAGVVPSDVTPSIVAPIWQRPQPCGSVAVALTREDLPMNKQELIDAIAARGGDNQDGHRRSGQCGARGRRLGAQRRRFRAVGWVRDVFGRPACSSHRSEPGNGRRNPDRGREDREIYSGQGLQGGWNSPLKVRTQSPTYNSG